MNKEDVVSMVAASAGISKAVADNAISSFVDTVKLALADGQSVQLNNFGTFALQKRNERVGRNPHTGEAVPIPARYIVKFTPSGDFRLQTEQVIEPASVPKPKPKQ